MQLVGSPPQQLADVGVKPVIPVLLLLPCVSQKASSHNQRVAML